MKICRTLKVVVLIQLTLVNTIFSSDKLKVDGGSYYMLSSTFPLNKKDSIILKRLLYAKELFKKKSYPEALSEAQIVLKNSSNNNELKLLSSFLIAEIFDKTNNYEKALKHYKIVYNLKVRNLLEKGLSQSYSDSQYAKILFRIGSSFHKLNVLDSAKIYYNKLEKLNILNPEILKLQAMSFSNISGIYEGDSIFDLAKKYAIKSIQIHKDMNNRVEESASTINLGNIFLSESKYSEAKGFYFKALNLIKNDNGPVAVKYKANLYYNLAWAMRNLKDYKAYDFQELSYEIQDDLRDKEFRGTIDEIYAKFNFDNKKEFLLKSEENKRLKDQRTFWIFGIGSFIVMISLVYFLNLYKLKQKNLRLKLSQTQLLQNQNIEKLKSESQARILNATIDGKETERKEIAETLHDSVSALLSSANLHLMAAKPLFKGDIPIEIGKTQSIIAEASQKIRDLSHTLVSSVLLKFGLNFAIKDIATKYSNSVLQIDTDISSLRRYHQDFEIKIYNIIQEFVNNILKHSKASYTLITLYEKDKNLCFQITDDGVGFDKNKAINKDGLGLNQIEARIRMMNGKFLIESTIGEGTTISVELPVIEKS